MNAPQAIIFDLDGLLVDSESVWHLAESAMLADRGKAYSGGMRAQVIGLRMDEFLVKLKEMLALSESVEALAQDATNRMLTLIPHKVHAQPGAKELVSYVARHNIPCAIASSSPPNIIDAMVQAQNWEQVFTVRCSAESEAHGKPAPDVYLTAARQLGIDPARCLALEDSPNGARAAVAAGMTCYTVPDPSHSSPAAFAGITPHVFSDLHAVLAAIKANA